VERAVVLHALPLAWLRALDNGARREQQHFLHRAALEVAEVGQVER
jgi:hypothetical protein